ncbi:MAG: rane protein required for colicin production [Betaproteobacteria bacterium]|jgi:membrane protein required for colicin V production|nr:rane protein required for colicin production [Betaproteobacteria bacterium]
MSVLDLAAIGVIVGSVGLGIWRGFTREVMSLAGWVLAFLAANTVAGPLGDMLPVSIASPEVRVLIAFLVVFVLTLIAAAIVGMIVSKFLKAAGLSGVDRTLGGLFGLARGVVILLAFAIVAGLTAMPRQPFWKESVSAGMLERTVVQLKVWLPPALAGRLKYN